MSKIEYKDVPIYFAHEDGTTLPESARIAINLSAQTVTDNYQAADAEIKEWVSANFQSKS